MTPQEARSGEAATGKATSLTGSQRRALADLRERPAFAVRNGWRLLGGRRIAMKTALSLFGRGLVERVATRSGRDAMRLTAKGLEAINDHAGAAESRAAAAYRARKATERPRLYGADLA